MRSNVRLGRFSGIDIGLHWSIVLVFAVLLFSLSGSVLPEFAPGYDGAMYLGAAGLTAMAFLGSIVAHELGHSIVAQRNDVGVKHITLFALGGVAVLESEPKTAGAAGRIAAAGPAVSVAVGVGALGAAAGVAALSAPALLTASLVWLGIINLGLAVFNMIPALPLDGGRVLQSVLWARNGEPHQATISAARLGRYIGWGLIVLGLWQFTSGGAGLWTAVIGWFVLTTAKAEARRAKYELRRQAHQAQWQQWIGSFPANATAGAAGTASGQTVIDVDGWIKQ